jgi:hypothetical protein
MAGTKLSFYRENTVNINLSFTGVDLTGATVYFTVKPAYDSDQADTAAIIKKDITSHTSPTAGLTTITLTPTDTAVTPGKYGYDIKLKKASGEQSTVTVGQAIIKDAYTLRG